MKNEKVLLLIFLISFFFSLFNFSIKIKNNTGKNLKYHKLLSYYFNPAIVFVEPNFKIHGINYFVRGIKIYEFNGNKVDQIINFENIYKIERSEYFIIINENENGFYVENKIV